MEPKHKELLKNTYTDPEDPDRRGFLSVFDTEDGQLLLHT